MSRHAGPPRIPSLRASGRPAPKHRRPQPPWPQRLAHRFSLARRGLSLPRSLSLSRQAGIALTACGVAVVSAGLTGWALAGHPASRADSASTGRPPHVRAPSGRTAPWSSGAAKVARPVRLVIPAISVSTRLIRLGVTSSGALAVPASADVAGWFTGSPRPGAIGPAVIVGHIDSKLEPGVFFRLRLLRRGQRVYVVRADRSVVTFTVTAIRSAAKVAFPSAAVYGPEPDVELRLITCGGQFDYATGSYLSNVIVYSTLVAEPSRLPGAGRRRSLERSPDFASTYRPAAR